MACLNVTNCYCFDKVDISICFSDTLVIYFCWIFFLRVCLFWLKEYVRFFVKVKLLHYSFRLIWLKVEILLWWTKTILSFNNFLNIISSLNYIFFLSSLQFFIISCWFFFYIKQIFHIKKFIKLKKYVKLIFMHHKIH